MNRALPTWSRLISFLPNLPSPTYQSERSPSSNGTTGAADAQFPIKMEMAPPLFSVKTTSCWALESPTAKTSSDPRSCLKRAADPSPTPYGWPQQMVTNQTHQGGGGWKARCTVYQAWSRDHRGSAQRS